MSICALLALVVTLTAGPAWAHPGRLAADGCHYCRTNCAKWSEVEGVRHCHRDRQKARARQSGQPPPRHPQAAQDRIRKIPIEIRDRTPRIVDADTLEMAGQRVRLQGIDAPEAAQSCRQATGHRYRCGDRATQALRARIGTSPVTCTAVSAKSAGVIQAATRARTAPLIDLRATTCVVIRPSLPLITHNNGYQR